MPTITAVAPRVPPSYLCAVCRKSLPRTHAGRYVTCSDACKAERYRRYLRARALEDVQGPTERITHGTDQAEG
jgi:predicted nucleic acid-binding Zn ribbon protein